MTGRIDYFYTNKLFRFTTQKNTTCKANFGRSLQKYCCLSSLTFLIINDYVRKQEKLILTIEGDTNEFFVDNPEKLYSFSALFSNKIRPSRRLGRQDVKIGELRQ